MATQTRKASKAPRKRTQSSKARANQELPPSKRVKKLPKRQKSVPPEEIANAPLEPSELSDEGPEGPEDVSGVEYTLSWCVLLDEIELASDTDVYKLGQFNYREFSYDLIKIVTKATIKAKKEFEWVSGSATMIAKGLTKTRVLKIAVNDEDGWKKVEYFVEKWMREHKRDINVKLIVTYQKKTNDDEESSDDERANKKSKKVSVFKVFDY
jgi:hypothetical protein